MQELLPIPDCIEGIFLRRVKRFTIEFSLDNRCLLAHTNNSGAMLGLLHHGSRALFSKAENQARKLAYTLERIKLPERMGGAWVGVNTQLPNRILEAAFKKGQLPFCAGYKTLTREIKIGNSRMDALCTHPGLPPLWIECKSVTLVEDERAAFPDAASARAAKHLLELIKIVESGQRAAMFYLVQRNDALCFGPADYIDPAYAALFRQALKAGVEMYAVKAQWCRNGIGLGQLLYMGK